MGAILRCVAILGLVAAMSRSSAFVTTKAQQTAEGQHVTPSQLDVVLVDTSGRRGSLKQYAHQTIVLAFWTPWAPTSARALRPLTLADSEYRSRGVQVVAVALDVPLEKSQYVTQVAKDAGINFPMLLDQGDAAKLFAITGVPTILLIRKDGMVARQYREPPNAADLFRDLNRLIR